jgi:hypothetical protein
MRNLHKLDKYRYIDQKVVDMYGSLGDENFGAFQIDFRSNKLFIIASSGDGWDHVSVSLRTRTPNWYEMEYVARLFFNDNEYAVQYHVPTQQHVNIHDNCLHWWRPHLPLIILMPPPIFV